MGLSETAHVMRLTLLLAQSVLYINVSCCGCCHKAFYDMVLLVRSLIFPCLLLSSLNSISSPPNILVCLPWLPKAWEPPFCPLLWCSLPPSTPSPPGWLLSLTSPSCVRWSFLNFQSCPVLPSLLVFAELQHSNFLVLHLSNHLFVRAWSQVLGFFTWAPPGPSAQPGIAYLLHELSGDWKKSEILQHLLTIPRKVRCKLGKPSSSFTKLLLLVFAPTIVLGAGAT